MIATLPALPGPAPAAAPGLTPVTGPTGTDMTGPDSVSSGVLSTLPVPSVPVSFATALQSRLRLMALNTPDRSPVSIAPTADAGSFDLDLAINHLAPPLSAPASLAAKLVATEIKETPGTFSDKAAADNKPSEDLTTSQGEPAPAVVDATAPPVAPIALPFPPLAMPQAQPLAPAVPDKPGASTHAQRPAPLALPATAFAPATLPPPPSAAPGSDISQQTNTPPAILAADTEKTASPTAIIDQPSGKSAFAEVLRDTLMPAGNEMNPIRPVADNSATIPLRQVATHVGAPQWSADVGNQLSWMVSQRETQADLVLNPPQLGRIEVSITLNGDQANATLVSASPEVREILQGSLPRLREVLADAGISLGQAHIGAESSGRGGNSEEKSPKSSDDSFSSPQRILLGSTQDSTPLGAGRIVRGGGLVDLFA